MKKVFQLLFAATLPLTAPAAVPVDFDRIEHWTGEGPNRAALVITNDGGASDPYAYVWGYRWADGEMPTGETMFRAICANSSELVLFTQLSGIYGSTVCGIGFGNADKILENIYFDFAMAKSSKYINFDYYNTSSLFGQADAPGEKAPEIAAQAISDALHTGSHVIDHPFNHRDYGYPAYDYDCWLMKDEGWDYGWWSAAWYTGYWSYWTAAPDSTDWMYSGTGFSGRTLSDGAVDGWTFTPFATPGVGGSGEGAPPPSEAALYSYRSAGTTTIEPGITADGTDGTDEWFTHSGIPVAQGASSASLQPGIYLVRSGRSVRKVIIK